MADDRESGAAGTPSPDWDALARYLAGEGDAVERARVEQKIAADPARASLLAALDDALRAATPAAVTPAEVDAALQAVLARRAQGDEGSAKVVPLFARRSRWPSIGARAAAAIIVVVGAVLTWRAASHQTNGHGNRSALAAGHRFTSGVGVVDSLVLSDSTLVILGPASTLAVAAGYGASSRELRLRGQALFDVR